MNLSAFEPHAIESMQRRRVLKLSAQLAALLGCSLLGARGAVAQGESLAFDAVTIDDTLRALGGQIARDAQIVLAIPDVVENGAFVPVSVSCALPGTQEIYIVVESNPNPLVVRFTIPDGTEAFVATRVKMADSGRVYAVVKADGQLYSAFRQTQVTVGGCG